MGNGQVRPRGDMEEEEEEVGGMSRGHQTTGKCDTLEAPNSADTCVKCLPSEVDITKGLQKSVIIVHCGECDKYLLPPRTWITAQLESKEMLVLCLKRLGKDLNKVSLVHAEIIWTVPQSKRINVMLRVQKAFLNGAVLEQEYTVQYVVQEHMCGSCSNVQSNPDRWVAVVQLRQRVSHWKTFLYLEQLILKHDAAVRAIRIKRTDQGIDFFFTNQSHAVKFVDFVDKLVLIRSGHDKQLVSLDPKSNMHSYKHIFSVEICPICREDLICLPPEVAVSLGNLGSLVICIKVRNNIVLLDPFTLRHCFLSADQYWRWSLKCFRSSRQLVEYIVLNVETVPLEVSVAGSKYVLANAEVARVSDFGKHDKKFLVKTHLGHLLKPGDYALGYDLLGASHDGIELDKDAIVILVKKSYEESRKQGCGEPRPWKLKYLNMEVGNGRGRAEEEEMSSEYEQFMRDLEENPELRVGISFHRNEEYQPSEMTSVDGDDVPFVPIEELLADLEPSDEEADDQRIMEG